jgi:predicted RNase H-like nuclease (RuvC/YqgF family)
LPLDAAAVATALLGLVGGAAGAKLVEVIAGRRSTRVDDAGKLIEAALKLAESTSSELERTKTELAATKAEILSLRDALAATRREVVELRERQAHYDDLVETVEGLRQEMLQAARRIDALQRENAELRAALFGGMDGGGAR